MDDIVIEDLTKSYASGWPGRPPFVALDGLSLTVRRGEIFGFLGPNGAGKTTTLKILLGLVRATGGRALLLGQPAGDVETRRRIGFLPESPYFYDYLTADEFLTFYGQLAGLGYTAIAQRVTDLLGLVGLADARARQLRKFSKGMLQRIGLAQALIHDPELVILDEPMTGLDPVGRKQVRDLILSLRDRGKTIFFSTHILHDVEMICDRVGIVMKGRLLASGRVGRARPARSYTVRRDRVPTDQGRRECVYSLTCHTCAAARSAMPDRIAQSGCRGCHGRRDPAARRTSLIGNAP